MALFLYNSITGDNITPKQTNKQTNKTNIRVFANTRSLQIFVWHVQQSFIIGWLINFSCCDKHLHRRQLSEIICLWCFLPGQDKEFPAFNNNKTITTRRRFLLRSQLLYLLASNYLWLMAAELPLNLSDAFTWLINLLSSFIQKLSDPLYK